MLCKVSSCAVAFGSHYCMLLGGAKEKYKWKVYSIKRNTSTGHFPGWGSNWDTVTGLLKVAAFFRNCIVLGYIFKLRNVSELGVTWWQEKLHYLHCQTRISLYHYLIPSVCQVNVIWGNEAQPPDHQCSDKYRNCNCKVTQLHSHDK